MSGFAFVYRAKPATKRWLGLQEQAAIQSESDNVCSTAYVSLSPSDTYRHQVNNNLPVDRLHDVVYQPLPMKVICCWCVPPHVIQDGVEPASHGMCDAALSRFEAEMDAAGVKP